MALYCRHGLVALLLLLPACGGSSSETPPPLEPDFDRAPAQAASGDGRVMRDDESPGAQPGSDDVVEAAPATWGGDAGASRRPPIRTRPLLPLR